MTERARPCSESRTRTRPRSTREPRSRCPAVTFGWTFFNASNGTYVNYAYGYVTDAPAVPIWGFPGLLASYLIDSHIVQAIIVFAFGAWWLGWTGTLFLSSTRMIFAA